jgi:hypothetical protein
MQVLLRAGKAASEEAVQKRIDVEEVHKTVAVHVDRAG